MILLPANLPERQYERWLGFTRYTLSEIIDSVSKSLSDLTAAIVGVGRVTKEIIDEFLSTEHVFKK